MCKMPEYSGLRFYQPSKDIGTFGEKKDDKDILDKRELLLSQWGNFNINAGTT